MKIATEILIFAIFVMIVGAGAVIIADNARASLWIVTSTNSAAAQSILDCGNIAVETHAQAQAYAARRPGSRMFKVIITEAR